MKESLTADRIANAIIQRRKKYENFLLVEGTHDRLFFLKFKSDSTQVEISFGWEKLIEIINKLKERGFNKVIGVIDKDLREMIPEEFQIPENIHTTDYHDINISCLEESFSVVFESINSDDKTESFKSAGNVECIKSYTYSLVRPLSYLRILNKRNKLNLTFKSNDSKKNRFDYAKFIDKDKYEFVSLEKLIETVTNFSRNKTDSKILPNNEILELLKQLIDEENFDDRLLNNGHDFGEIICIGLRRVLGSKDIESDTFLRECILAYDSSRFIETKLFATIKTNEITQETTYLNL